MVTRGNNIKARLTCSPIGFTCKLIISTSRIWFPLYNMAWHCSSALHGRCYENLKSCKVIGVHAELLTWSEHHFLPPLSHLLRSQILVRNYPLKLCGLAIPANKSTLLIFKGCLNQVHYFWKKYCQVQDVDIWMNK